MDTQKKVSLGAGEEQFSGSRKSFPAPNAVSAQVEHKEVIHWTGCQWSRQEQPHLSPPQRVWAQDGPALVSPGARAGVADYLIEIQHKDNE